MPEPITSVISGERHLTGTCVGRPRPGNGTAISSKKAKADASSGFALKEIRIEKETHGGSDEGDYDTYHKHQLFYKGELVWTFQTSDHSNFGGSWGVSSSCKIQDDLLVMDLDHKGREIVGGWDTPERREYRLEDILKESAGVWANNE